MTDGEFIGAGPRSLRLDTLVRLRWLAVTGQAATVLIVNIGLGFPLRSRSVSR